MQSTLSALRRLGLLGSLCLFSAASVAGISIGPVCMDGVKSLPDEDHATVEDQGRWVPTSYVINDPKARLVIFPTGIPPANPPKFETCAQTEARLAQLSIKPILSGMLAQLQLNALLYFGPDGSRLQINKGNFQAAITRVERGSHSVDGGTIDFSGSKAWLAIAEDLFSKGNTLLGEMSVETWGKTIRGAVISMPGGAEYNVDLQQDNASNVTLRMDLATGHASLYEAKMKGSPKGIVTLLAG
jgi:hypothetical protein